MAKDGTNRGGARIGAGAKKKPLADKIAEGNPGKRKLTVIEFEDKATAGAYKFGMSGSLHALLAKYVSNCFSVFLKIVYSQERKSRTRCGSKRSADW